MRDVREEDRQFLPLGRDSGAVRAGENRIVQLGRQEFGQFGRQLSEELVLFSQFDLCPPELDKSGGDGDNSEQNDQLVIRATVERRPQIPDKRRAISAASFTSLLALVFLPTPAAANRASKVGSLPFSFAVLLRSVGDLVLQVAGLMIAAEL